MIYWVHCKKHNGQHEYMGRPSVLGNPFSHKENTKAAHKCESREESIAKYRDWLISKIESKDRKVCAELNRLYKIAIKGDLYLSCWCYPLDCHCRIIKEVLESKIESQGVV